MRTLYKILLMIILMYSGSFLVFGVSPYKEDVDEFLRINSYDPTAVETDYYTEQYCAYYLRRHTTLLFGKIINVPMYTGLFVFTPFHYINYIEPETLNQHVYVFINTADNGILVYNPVNGIYIGRFDELLYSQKPS